MFTAVAVSLTATYNVHYVTSLLNPYLYSIPNSSPFKSTDLHSSNKQTMVPTLIESIKVAGLVLVMDMSSGTTVTSSRERGYKMPDGVDGVMKSNGVLRFNETIDM